MQDAIEALETRSLPRAVKRHDISLLKSNWTFRSKRDMQVGATSTDVRIVLGMPSARRGETAITVRLSDAELNQLDRWIESCEAPRPSRAQAVRILLQLDRHTENTVDYLKSQLAALDANVITQIQKIIAIADQMALDDKESGFVSHFNKPN